MYTIIHDEEEEEEDDGDGDTVTVVKSGTVLYWYLVFGTAVSVPPHR